MERARLKSLLESRHSNVAEYALLSGFFALGAAAGFPALLRGATRAIVWLGRFF
jgi:hypothetical protein